MTQPIRFKDLASGDQFYFIDELLREKKRACRKVGSHSYTDTMGLRTIWFTWVKVYPYSEVKR